MTSANTQRVRNRVRKTPGEIAFTIFIYIFITAFTICCLYPFINVIATSFSSSRAVSSGEVNLIPVEFNLDAYDQLLLDGQAVPGGLWRGKETASLGAILATQGAVLQVICLEDGLYQNLSLTVLRLDG